MSKSLSHIALVGLLAFPMVGCKTEEPDAIAKEQAPPAIDCQQVPLAAMEGREAHLMQRPWDPLTVLVLGKPKGCPSKRLDIYDLKTHERTAAVVLPSTSDTSGWRPHDHPKGDYMSLFSSAGRGYRLLLVHAASGQIGFDSANAADRLASARERMFTDLFRHVEAVGDRVFMELNDGSIVEVDWEAKTTTPSTYTELWKVPTEAASAAGCSKNSSDRDTFGRPRHSPTYDLRGAELGVHDVYWEGEHSKATLVYRDEHKTELFRVQEPLFHPEVFSAACSESRTSPGPLLVLHRANLDINVADTLISRIDGTGNKRWTVTLPRQHDEVRWFDDTLVVLDTSGWSIGVTWIDLAEGRIIETKQLDR